MGTSDVVAVGPPVSIDPSRIAHALRELWKDAERQENGAKNALVRACGLTLIAIAPHGAEFDRVRADVSESTGTVPARTILIEIGADVTVPIHAEVTAYCAVKPGSNKQVCQELVTLRIRAEAAADLAGVVAPLVVTDLPVVLLVPQADLLAAAWLDRLLPLADVLVTDSARCTSLSKALERLLRRSADPHLSIRDIAYERLSCWRELLADLWDETIGIGHRLDAVELEAERGDPMGVMLHAFIAVALGHDGASRTRRVPLRAETRSSGASLALTFATSFKGQARRATLTQYGRHVTHAHDGTESCDLPRPVQDDAEILHSILLGTDCDSMFERVLAKALDLHGPTA